MDKKSSAANYNYQGKKQSNIMADQQNQQFASNQRPAQVSQLKHINFDLADIYFPIFVLQIRFDIFPLRNRNYNNYQGRGNNNYQAQQQQQNDNSGFAEVGDDEYDLLQEFNRQSYETSCKIFYILRDQFLLTKVIITGTVAFLVKKDEKYFFGIDDSTGVITCVLWLNDYNNQGGQAGRRQQDFREWFADNNISTGSCLSVQGALEYFQDKLQVTAYKLRVINNSNEEMLQYQQTISAQKCFFDPLKPYQRRLFNQQVSSEYQMIQPQPAQQQDDNQQKRTDEVILSSYKRVKKRINDFIMNNYNEIFSTTITTNNEDVNMDDEQQEQQENLITAEDILTNQKLVKKVEEELQLCEEKDKKTRDVIQECLVELEEKGFLNITGNTTQQYLLQFTKQRKNLKIFISNELKKNSKGLSFKDICSAVTAQYKNFYTKDFIFKVIDDLFQMGLIIEIGKHVYAYLDNQI